MRPSVALLCGVRWYSCRNPRLLAVHEGRFGMRCESSDATSVTKNMSESRRGTFSKFFRNRQRRWAMVAGSIATVFLWTATPALRAQEKNPFAGDARVAKLGEYQFRLNCAFCHGLGARGGGRGPDLTHAQKHHGNTDGEIFHNIHEGIACTAMPAAKNGGIGGGMLDEAIWHVVTYIRSLEKKASAAETGNAAHGKALFYGSATCGTCHLVSGKAAPLGPHLPSP